LIVLGTYTGDWHHDKNLNALLEAYGLAFNVDVILPQGSVESDGFQQVVARDPSSKQVVEAIPANQSEAHQDAGRLLQGVQKVLTLSACSISVDSSLATPLIISQPQDVPWEPVPFGRSIRIQGWTPRRQDTYTLVAVSKIAKVVVVGGWKMFTDAFIQDQRYQNKGLFRNILAWCSEAQ
jgi:hypothetical protein